MAIVKRKAKDGSMRYLVRVRDAIGQWFKEKPLTFKRYVDAERREREFLTKRDRGVSALSGLARSLLMVEYWAKWSEERRARTSEGWKMTQNQMWRDHIAPVIGKMALGDIRSPHIGVLLGRLYKRGLSSSTILHVYNLLHKMFGDAIDYYEFIEINPVKKHDRPKLKKKSRNFLKPEEAVRFLKFCERHPLGPAVWIGILSGLRPSEIQALKWESVDFENKEILICAGYKRKVKRVENYPKQRDWGRAPMPDDLCTYLAQFRVGMKNTDFVVQGPNGTMLKYEYFYGALKRVCKQAGVTEIRPHELRHSTSELYFNNGATVEDIRRLLNQSSLNATAAYIHKTSDRVKLLAKNVVSLLPAGVPVADTHLIH